MSQPETISEDDARLLLLAYDSSDDDSDVTDDTRCKYPSKFCGNARAAKASGKLHRFCEHHRQRANVNQKRWTAVRRQGTRQRGTMQLDPAWVASTMANYYRTMALPNSSEQAYTYLNHQSVLDSRPADAPALSDDELQMLAALLGPTDPGMWPLEDQFMSMDDNQSTIV